MLPLPPKILAAYHQEAIALDCEYESDHHKDLNQQHYAFQDDYELMPALAEMIAPSATPSLTNPIATQ
ncbi:hypothetical protein FLX56_28375 [Synechococcus moorigangaii CMS01]|nr:hypothetical protein [Synechococcus moorigangaii CMS01]